ncbi:MAG: SpoIIE family protein phosphatase [Erysipelotrichaceae bacterium]|nr:SpoIIE family protein phosphatase [Erysipelotrichaceae bacterium]MBR3167674.1 SpoIIE family protein phosphatase [Erysipelotrichaceae bacterium]
MSEKIHIDAAWRSLNKKEEELCGDRVQIRRGNDCTVMVLADGLGSGVKANILSTLTSTIISEMISSGMSLKEAVETIVDTLPVDQERGIAYSTFTIIQAYYDGLVKIAQYDSPQIVIMRDNKVLHLPMEEHELSGKKVTSLSFNAEPGDLFVTFSDGILWAGVGMYMNFGWGQKEVENFLEEFIEPADPAREVARILLANVNHLYDGMPGDDSTVACIRVKEARETRVMVGPPSEPSMDREVVSKLVSASGYKVCCGGTTSQIVSGVLGRELTTDISQILASSDVPPKGFIRGIDLVTEGVLTLQKVGRILRKATLDNGYVEKLLGGKDRDAAFELTRFLLESSAVTFMVGLSDNPAHDAINYSPISLSAKIELINEIGERLTALGKIVRIEKY